MRKKLNTSIALAALCLTAMFSMGVQGCSDPKEYCKFYDANVDQADCTSYCENNRDFERDKIRDSMIRSCQLGQVGYISNIRISVAEALLGCDRHFKDNTDLAMACRAGVTAEQLRASKTPHRGSGTSSDRETGNNK